MRFGIRAMFLGLVWTPGCADRRTVPSPGWDGWAAGEPPARVPLRVATWNVQSVSAADSPSFEALVDVLDRVDADVVALNEVVDAEAEDLDALAARLGYGTVVRDDVIPFGDLGNAILSRVPVVSSSVQTGATLAGGDTRDLTRGLVEVRVQVPGTSIEVGVVSLHFKSGFEPVDAFRRAVDAWRTGQAAGALEASDLAVVLGDVNSEPEQRYDPPTFAALPDDLPDSYRAGSDVVARLGEGGLDADPLAQLAAAGWRRLPLLQRDGDEATRPTSGRVIDHVLVDDRADRTPIRGEVYDCEDDTEDQPGVADGDPLARTASCARASDHLPVVIELSLSAESSP